MADKMTGKQTGAADKGAGRSQSGATGKSEKGQAAEPMSKGDKYLCEICGLQVNVDICGEYLEKKGLSCCGKAMKKQGE
jgi:hypothetical protein